MSDVVIKAEGLGKSYLIGHQGQRERYTALRDVLANQVRGVWGATRRALRGQAAVNGAEIEEFWALRDVSFEVKQGEVVGIIGRNGAGKSTLLKILSRITEPTEGRVTLNGRVASLLEVGTGFHPELTGRENIFLNGAILGMTRAEIKRKFDEIVSFAEVERFLDTPVKRYSSGMYVRLAFAVAAHLEPEILLVDEVLAVGDAEFQQKCLGKMQEVSRIGRTVLFVSHNMSAMQKLCESAILLDRGTIAMADATCDVVQKYMNDGSVAKRFNRPPQPKGKPTIVSGTILARDDCSAVRVELRLAGTAGERVSLDLRVMDSMASPVGFGSLGAFDDCEKIELSDGLTAVEFDILTDQLAVGSYHISLDLTWPEVEFFDRIENCLCFEVVSNSRNGRTRSLSQKWGYGSYEVPIIPVNRHHAIRTSA
jgi:lipopolysaccharide transport system ATP-binding protein